MAHESITDKLRAILNIKDAIKAAIIFKGVEIKDSTLFEDYAQAIRSIEGGGGSSGNDVRSKVIGAISDFGLIISENFNISPLLVSNNTSEYPMEKMSDNDISTFWSAESNSSLGEWVIFNDNETFKDNEKIGFSVSWNNPWGECPYKIQTFAIPNSDVTKIQAGTLNFFDSNYYIVSKYEMNQFTGTDFVPLTTSLESFKELKQLLGTDDIKFGMLMFTYNGSVKIAECKGIKHRIVSL